MVRTLEINELETLDDVSAAEINGGVAPLLVAGLILALIALCCEYC